MSRPVSLRPSRETRRISPALISGKVAPSRTACGRMRIPASDHFTTKSRGSSGERGKDGRVCEAADGKEHVVEDEPEQSDDHLDRRVRDERFPDAGAPARRERGADGHPAEVDDEDDDLRVGAVADEEPEVAAPDGLVDEPGGAGEDEDGDEQDGHGRRSYRPVTLLALSAYKCSPPIHHDAFTMKMLSGRVARRPCSSREKLKSPYGC